MEEKLRSKSPQPSSTLSSSHRTLVLLLDFMAFDPNLPPPLWPVTQDNLRIRQTETPTSLQAFALRALRPN